MGHDSCWNLVRLSKSLTSRLAVRIKERFLSDANGSVPTPLSKSIIVVCGRMEDAAVVPDCDIIGLLPLEPDLKIMVVND